MSELAYLARLNSPANKEMAITTVNVTEDSGEFTSGLTLGYTRKDFTFTASAQPAAEKPFTVPQRSRPRPGCQFRAGSQLNCQSDGSKPLVCRKNRGEHPSQNR